MNIAGRVVKLDRFGGGAAETRSPYERSIDVEEQHHDLKDDEALESAE